VRHGCGSPGWNNAAVSRSRVTGSPTLSENRTRCVSQKQPQSTGPWLKVRMSSSTQITCGRVSAYRVQTWAVCARQVSDRGQAHAVDAVPSGPTMVCRPGTYVSPRRPPSVCPRVIHGLME